MQVHKWEQTQPLSGLRRVLGRGPGVETRPLAPRVSTPGWYDSIPLGLTRKRRMRECFLVSALPRVADVRKTNQERGRPNPGLQLCHSTEFQFGSLRSQDGERQGQPPEPAADDVRFVSGRIGWLRFAGPFGSHSFILQIAYSSHCACGSSGWR